MRAYDNCGEVHEYGDMRRRGALRHDSTALCGYCGPKRQTTKAVDCPYCIQIEEEAMTQERWHAIAERRHEWGRTYWIAGIYEQVATGGKYFEWDPQHYAAEKKAMEAALQEAQRRNSQEEED